MLEVFKDAITLMISAGKRMIDSALNQAEVLLKVRNLLLEVKRRNKKVHTIGMGRSGLAGKFFAELLKLRRIKASTIGDTLAKPVDSGDVVFAFSGSGWTTTTTLYSELCLRRGAILIALTATKGSKLDRLADYTIYLLGKPVLAATDYIARKIAGRYKTPLAPMGSIPEFSALLVSAGIAAMIDSDEPLDAFRRTLEVILDVADRSMRHILVRENALLEFILHYEDARKNGAACYFYGIGLLNYISEMISMRFQHLGLNVNSILDWILRRREDILTVISGSGEASIPRILVEEGRRTGMKVLSVVGNENSTIARLSDVFLVLEDIEERKRYFELGREEPEQFIPAFEIASFILFEAIVAELARRFGITEEEMKVLHANIE